MISQNKNLPKPELIWIEKIAILLDNKFHFPGTKIQYGLDPLIGLIPVIGNLTTFFISGALFFVMSKYGASRKVMILMLLNIFLDTIIGSIPILGNVFDFAFKSNVKNINLLKSHYHEGKHSGNGNWIIGLIFLLFSLLLIGSIYLIYLAFKSLINLF